MKKIALLAIATVVGASLNTAEAAKKKKKDKKEAPVENVITLSSSQDTLSYAAGVTRTEGLIPYLKQALKVDTAYMADFVRGYNDVAAKGENKAMTAYAAGMQIAQMVQQRMLPALEKEFEGFKDTINVEKFHAGFTGALCPGKELMNDSVAKAYFKAQSDRVIKAKNQANRQAGEKFLEENKAKPGVQTTASGLQYKVITKGTGAVPKATDEVKVNYEGRLIDGTVFDSSYKRQQPTTFRADKVIAGWTEALTMMPVGSKWEIYIPQNLAYGERQAGQLIKPFSTLVFTVELLGISDAADTAKAGAGNAAKQLKPATAGKKMPVARKVTPAKTRLKAKK